MLKCTLFDKLAKIITICSGKLLYDKYCFLLISLHVEGAISLRNLTTLAT